MTINKNVVGYRSQDRRMPHMGTFQEAQRWIRSVQDAWGNKRFDLEFDPCGIYYVTKDGQVLGRGETYEQAFQEAERNYRHETGNLTLAGMEGA